jgi:hypothetical protein
MTRVSNLGRCAIQSRAARTVAAAAVGCGGGFLASGIASASPPKPQPTVCNVLSSEYYYYAVYNDDDSGYPNFYVEWDPSNYSDPSSIQIYFYQGIGVTELGTYGWQVYTDAGQNYGGPDYGQPLWTWANTTSQSFLPWQAGDTDTLFPDYNHLDNYSSSPGYEIGLAAYDGDSFSDIAWIGASEE